ncbi:MAG: bacteriohemerythrin, partial [Chromatiales bacterium]|nr:bacteriohemerythrin [Chromatiales bacterium]
DSAGEGIYGMNNDGNVIFANTFTINRLGWSESELIGQNIHDLAHHTHANGEPYLIEDCPSHATLVDGSSHNIVDEILWCKDGNSFPVEYTSRPIIEDGKQKGAVVVFRDISKRRKAEAALRRTQKMEALGKLTGGIAHDFNNMLGVILGFSKLLLRKVEYEPKLESYAQQIVHAGERCKMLTTKLLSLSHQDELSAESTNINQLIEGTQHILEKTLTARIELKLDLAEEIWPVWLDKSSLEDAILNMSINTMHAIEDQGSFKLVTRNVSLASDELSHLKLSSGDYVALSLADSGSGMDQDIQNHIFDPFFSTKGDQGTGLGMSQVYGFVQRSGGDIHIDSEVGRGTLITIYFPRYSKTANPSVAEKNFDLEVEPLGHETILVVDDEESIRQLSEELLKVHGYRVLCAENGDKALNILKSESVDLLLSDIIMPGMDGYQLAEEVSKNYPDIKIQMFSGFSDNRHTESHKKLHEKLLRKPFTSEILLQRIRELLDEDESNANSGLLQHIEWSDAISTGIVIVDEDHKMLVSILNRCIDVTNSEKPDEELGNILEELLEFIAYHFRREEVVMEVCEYPDLEVHRQEHKRLSDSVHLLINEFSHKGLTTMALLRFLRGWLKNHIIARDKEIAPYCQRKDMLLEKALIDAGLTRE